jgi:hypothetical protein
MEDIGAYHGKRAYEARVGVAKRVGKGQKQNVLAAKQPQREQHDDGRERDVDTVQENQMMW